MNIVKILEAVSFAAEAHKDQKRKYELTPYVNHCIRVAAMVSTTENATQDMIIAALLHDVLEDCPLYKEEHIFARFGYTVTDYVKALTHPPLSFGNRALRKKKECEQLWESLPQVQTIKYADIIDNLPSIVNNDSDFGPRFVQEKKDLMTHLNMGDLKLFDIAKKMVNDAWELYCNKEKVA